jgi:hypothetical protein
MVPYDWVQHDQDLKAQCDPIAKEVVMTKIMVIAVLLGRVGLAVAQDQVPAGNKSEAATRRRPRSRTRRRIRWRRCPAV